MTRDLAFIDTETTGLNPESHELLEVAAYVVGDRRFDTIHFSLEIDVDRADQRALEINGYHDRREELARIRMPDRWAASLLSEKLKDVTPVGNNVAFDLAFLSAFLSLEGHNPRPWNYAALDLKAFVAGRCGMTQPASTKLIAEVADVPLPEDAHTAIADAQWNYDVFKALTKAAI